MNRREGEKFKEWETEGFEKIERFEEKKTGNREEILKRRKLKKIGGLFWKQKLNEGEIQKTLRKEEESLFQLWFATCTANTIVRERKNKT